MDLAVDPELSLLCFSAFFLNPWFGHLWKASKLRSKSNLRQIPGKPLEVMICHDYLSDVDRKRCEITNTMEYVQEKM